MNKYLSFALILIFLTLGSCVFVQVFEDPAPPPEENGISDDVNENTKGGHPSAPDSVVSIEECARNSGRIVNTVAKGQCEADEKSIGSVEGMLSRSICCVKK